MTVRPFARRALTGRVAREKRLRRQRRPDSASVWFRRIGTVADVEAPAKAAGHAEREERNMTIARMDHFTILTTDAEKTVAFYRDLLGFEQGARPAFAFPGAWLYNDGRAVLHVVERTTIPEGAGVLDHMAFWERTCRATLAAFKARGIKYDLRRLPEDGHLGGLWQLFFFDPNGARVEIDFAASERGEPAPR